MRQVDHILVPDIINAKATQKSKFKLFSKSSSKTAIFSVPTPETESGNDKSDNNQPASDKSPPSSSEKEESKSTSTLKTLFTPQGNNQSFTELPTAQEQLLSNIKMENAMKETFQKGQQVIAILRYTPQDLNEMELIPGDIIEVLENVAEQDFWLAGHLLTNDKRFGQKGFIPKTCVCLNESSYLKRITSLTNDDIAFNSTSQEEHAAAKTTPKEHTTTQQEHTIHTTHTSATTIQKEHSPVPPGTQGIAKYSYEKKKNDEISFAAGNMIIVLKCSTGGWWKGINADEPGSKVPGWFPVNHIEFEKKTSGFLPTNQINTTDLPEQSATTTPTSVSLFKKRMKLVTSLDTDRSVSSPTLDTFLDTNQSNNSSDPNTTTSPVRENDEFDPNLLKSKSFVDEGAKSRGSLGKGGGRNAIHSRKSSSATDPHFDMLEEIHSAKIETLEEAFGEEMFEKLPDKEKKRLHGVLELIQTERDYVRDLVIIIEIFLKPMNNLTTIGPKNSTLLFGNIEQITSLNYKFLKQMLDLKITDVASFGELFLNIFEKFMCYIPYCSNQNQAWEKLTKPILNKSDIKQFLRDTHRNPSLRLLNIQGFLVKPIQRICKYPLFLKEMIKNTAPGHQDLIIMNRALEKVEQGLLVINESAKHLNGFKSLQEIQSRFVDKVLICNNSRFLLREDFVTAIYSDNQTKNRKILLFNDLLIICKLNNWNGKLTLIEKVALKEIRLYDVQDDKQVSVLEMELLPQYESDSLKRFLFSFSSSAEKMNWITAYKSLVRTTIKMKSMKDISLVESVNDEDMDGETSPISAEQDVSELYLKLERLESGISLRNEQIKAIQGEKEEIQSKYTLLEFQMDDLKIKVKKGDENYDEVNHESRNRDELKCRIENQEKKLMENEMMLADQQRLISVKENEIQSLNINLDKTTADFQSKIESQGIELSNAKEVLAKANESILARSKSREKLHEKMTVFNSIVSKEEELKTQILELQVQIASLELTNSQAQNQVENEKKDLLALLESKQNELIGSKRKVCELEDSFMEESSILQKEYDHLQFELSEEKIQNREAKEKLGFTIKNLENQVESLRKRANNVEKENQDIKAAKNDLENQYETTKHVFDKERKELQDQFKESKEEIFRLKVSIKQVSESLDTATNNFSKLADRAKKFENDNGILKEESIMLRTQVHGLIEKCVEIEEEKKSLCKKFDIEKKQLLIDYQKGLNTLNGENDLKIESLKNTTAALKEEVQKKNDEQYARDFNEINANMQRIEMDKKSLRDLLEIKEKKLQDTESGYQFVRLLYDKVLKELDSQKLIFTDQFEKREKDHDRAIQESKSDHEFKMREKMNVIASLEERIVAAEQTLSTNEQLHHQQTESLKSDKEKLIEKNLIFAADINGLNEEIQRLIRNHSESFCQMESLKSENIKLMENNSGLSDNVDKLTFEIQGLLKDHAEKMAQYREAAATNLLQNVKSFEEKLQEQTSLSDRLESAKASLMEQIEKLNEEKSLQISQVDILAGELRILKENLANRQMEIFDLKGKHQCLLNEKNYEVQDFSKKVDELNHMISFQSQELVNYQARFDSFQNLERELLQEIGQLKEKVKNIHIMSEKLKVAEQINLQLESLVSILNSKVIDFQLKISSVKESQWITENNILEEMKKKEDLVSKLNSKDEIITNLEETRLGLQTALDTAKEKIILENMNLEKMRSQNDQLVCETTTQKAQLLHLHKENENLNSSILHLQNSFSESSKKLDETKYQFSAEKNSLEIQKVDLEKDILVQLKHKDSCISNLNERIKLLEKSLDEDITKLTILEQNPAPNPKELLNSHILRKKLEDQYNISLKTIADLKSSFEASGLAADQKARKYKEESRMKIEISSKVISNLEEKNNQLDKLIVSSRAENSLTLSKLKECKNQYEVSLNSLSDHSDTIKALQQEKEELLLKMSDMSVEEKYLFESHMNGLKSDNLKNVETLQSAMATLELEKRHLYLKLESLKSSHDSFSIAYENEKENLIQQIRLLNDSSKSKDLLLLQLEKERDNSSSLMENLNAELKTKSIQIEDNVSQVSILSIQNKSLKVQLKSKDAKIFLLNQNQFVSTNLLISQRVAIESGLRNQLDAVNLALKAARSRELVFKYDSETTWQLLAKCQFFGKEITESKKLYQETLEKFQEERKGFQTAIESKNKEFDDFKQKLTLGKIEFEKIASDRERELKADNFTISKKLSICEVTIKQLDQEKKNLSEANMNLESLLNREVGTNQSLFNNNDDLRSEILNYKKIIKDFENDKHDQISEKEKLLLFKIDSLEKQIKLLEASLESSMKNGVNKIQRLAETERNLLIFEKNALEREKQILETEKASLKKEMVKILDEKEETVLDLTIKMKDVQHQLKKEIDILQKQIQEVKTLYINERDQHLEAKSKLQEIYATKVDLEVKSEEFQLSQKELQQKLDNAKKELCAAKERAASDLQKQAAMNHSQLLSKSSKIEELNSKNEILHKLNSFINNQQSPEEKLIDRFQQANSYGVDSQEKIQATIQSLQRKIKQLELEKEQISLTAAKSHSNEIHLLNVISDKSTEIRNVLQRINELEVANDRLKNSRTPSKKQNPFLKSQIESDIASLGNQVRIQREVLRIADAEVTSFKNAFLEISHKIKLSISWKSIPIAEMLQHTFDWSKNVDFNDYSNTKSVLYVVDAIQKVLNEKRKVSSVLENYKMNLNEELKEQRLTALKLEQAHGIIHQLQQKLEHRKSPYKNETLKSTQLAAKNDVLEKLFKKTASELSNCQSQIMELCLEKRELEDEFKELYEKMTSLKSNYQLKLNLAESDHTAIVESFKAEIASLNSTIDGLRAQASKIKHQKFLSDDLLKKSIGSAKSLAAVLNFNKK